ncbi:MAG: DUF1444 family protein [Firmicutes bacterium]|nr:DUF1444 family protein [Bacillota bacterium]
MAYLREHPDIQVREEKKDAIVVKLGEVDDIQCFLHNIYHDCTRASNSPEARREIYARFLAGLREGLEAHEPLSLETHREKILPRVVPEAFLGQFPPDLKLPHKPFAPGTGLIIAYVVDLANSVAYINTEQLAALGLNAEDLHELALANLEKTFTADIPAQVLAGGNVCIIKHLDSHDASRVLLVPRHLPEGAGLAALIPDRDTLVLAPVPTDGDWSALKKLARKAAGQPLFRRPLLVTREGFTVV